jgi:enoyl-CoA hydratase/carnithine racemase
LLLAGGDNPSMAGPPLLIERPREGMVRLVINDPGRRNPLSSPVFEAMTAALAGLPEGTRVVVLTGAGEEVFASGADMAELSRAGGAGLGGGFGEAMESALEAIEACAAPVIARIQGHSLGAGYQLALACDLRVAVDTARIGVPASRFGLLPGHRLHRRMLQQLGPQVTRELMLTGRAFNGGDALFRGLVDQVCPRGELDAAVDRLVDDILAGAPLTVRNSKRIINTLLGLDAGLGPATAAELDRLTVECHTSEVVREGFAAFFERRTPEFRGQ